MLPRVTRNTSVLFTRTKISLISTYRILKTTERISTKFYAIHAVVWEKLVVENIHEKKFRGKKFSS